MGLQQRPGGDARVICSNKRKRVARARVSAAAAATAAAYPNSNRSRPPLPPIIRFVQGEAPPTLVQTDIASFRSTVQTLTGNHHPTPEPHHTQQQEDLLCSSLHHHPPTAAAGCLSTHPTSSPQQALHALPPASPSREDIITTRTHFDSSSAGRHGLQHATPPPSPSLPSAESLDILANIYASNLDDYCCSPFSLSGEFCHNTSQSLNDDDSTDSSEDGSTLCEVLSLASLDLDMDTLSYILSQSMQSSIPSEIYMQNPPNL